MLDSDLMVASVVIVVAAGKLSAAMIERLPEESVFAVTTSELTEMGTAEMVDAFAVGWKYMAAVDLFQRAVNWIGG